MSVRLIASDGIGTAVPRTYISDMSLFTERPHLIESGSYELHCQVSSTLLNAFLEKVYNDSANLDITTDNFEQLQDLANELGFSKLDGPLRAFAARHSVVTLRTLEERVNTFELDIARFDGALGDIEDIVEQQRTTLRDHIDMHELLDADLTRLKSKIAKYEEVFDFIQRQLGELAEQNIFERVRALEEHAQMQVPVNKASTERSHETSPKKEQVLTQFAKRSDNESLSSNLERLKGKVRQMSAEDAPATVFSKSDPGRAKPVPPREFVYDQVRPLEGIIAHLTREGGGNVYYKGIVSVTASSVYDNNRSRYNPKNVFDLGTDSAYISKNEKDSWICCDFKDRRVIPTSYSMRSYFGGPGACHLKSWLLEGSKDGTENSWKEIDRRDNNSDMNTKHVTRNFKISRVPSEGFRFIRLKQTGKNHYGDHCLSLTSFEIFGTLREKRSPQAPPKGELVRQSSAASLVKQGREFGYVHPGLDGIVAHLTRECGGNVHDKGIVSVTASSVSTFPPKNAVDLGTGSEYQSNEEKDVWLCYDFKGRSVIPKSYSLRSNNGRSGPGGEYHKSWVIEVSNDDSSWREIDRRDCDLNGAYKISRVPSEGVRFFRIRMTGPPCQIRIVSMELFGTLFE